MWAVWVLFTCFDGPVTVLPIDCFMVHDLVISRQYSSIVYDNSTIMVQALQGENFKYMADIDQGLSS